MKDRGQMILIAGVMLAVVFVGLAVLVNAAIYTDNVATRGGDSASEALQYQSGVVDSVGGLVDAENFVSNDVSSIEDNVSRGIQRIDETQRQYNLRRGARTNTTLNGTVEGRLVQESGVADFTNWDANASAVRGFEIELDKTEMPTDDPFRIDLDGTYVEVNKTSGGNIVVTNETDTIRCEADTVKFDVTAQQLGGEPCRFGFPEFDADSQIAIENGTNGGGSYKLTIESEDAIGTDIPTNVATEALYSVDLDVRVDTPRISYERTVRVAPGEPDV